MPDWPPFFWRALIAGCVLGAIGGWFGPLVIQRRMAFLGAGLAHIAFAGVAVGLLVAEHVEWWDPAWGAVPITLGAALLITLIRTRTGLADDTLIGVAFAVAMALGILALSQVSGATRDATGYLFGSLLAIGTSDLWLLAGVVAICAATVPAWPRLAYASFDRDLARADGIPVVRDDLLLITAIALVVVAGVKLVGALLVAALLVIPAASARLLCRTFAGGTLCAVVLGIVGALGGLLLAWRLDWPAGGCVVAAHGLLFAGACLARMGASD